MVGYIQALLLALVQGVTEWLPVSSSAHLALLQKAMGVEPPLLFDIALHLGTLAAVVLYLRKDITAIVRNRDLRTVSLIVIASIPTAIIGFALHDFFESFFSDVRLVGAALILTGALLFATRYAKEAPNTGPDARSSFIIGLMQGIAVAPGISRSGSTIGAAMLLGVGREQAARFSFLLSIPAIIGAAAFEAKDAGFAIPDLGPTLLGVAVAAIAGYASIGFLMGTIRKGGFSAFAYYCWLLGISAIIWGMMG